MFVPLLFALIAAQGPKLTSVQAGTITRSVVSFLIPPDSPVGQHQVVGRTVVFDQAQSVRAFGPLVGAVDAKDIMPTLPALVMTREEAVRCAGHSLDCTVSHDGLFVAIDGVSTRDVRPGEYRVEATLLYTERTPAGRTELTGGTYSLVLGLVGGKYKYWSVLRSSRRPVR
ncbi:MAG: hypothetical protein KGL38_09885 [Gemmatimonadota bacterium]|nr:hypothetical protein [Gemmatimonadota bacterium]MDE3128303.1 hypothetical protein [Gemmatimonadota bacterium]MDE3174319.1 hypothetical protein [Gemmatimonadota bacterium]MDE3216622.1 hypothetical protein [Gemmatimonadota bacterium]